MDALCPHCETSHDASTQWRCEAHVNGDIPCVDADGHIWVVNDEDENICYCEKCGCYEY